jgi:hypothetical protein
VTGRNIDALAVKASAETEKGIPGEPEGVEARVVGKRRKAVYAVGERRKNELEELVRGRGS